jgi:acetyl-CoA C-acetyltransferase/acetyl-CoA acyltransferase
MEPKRPIAVIAGARTPFAKAFTKLQNVSAVDLGRTAVLDALRRSAMQPSDIDEVIFGNVAGPPDSANIARVIALKSGVPEDRIAHTVNRNCASGMESVINAWQSIQAGRAKTIIAGGTESMSNIPMFLSDEARENWMRLAKAKNMTARLVALTKFRPRHFKPVIGIELGLTDPVSGLNMGETAEVLAKEFAITREEQDAFALSSHQKAAAAQIECFLSGEIAPIEVGAGEMFAKDNGPRQQQSMQQLAKLRPIFASDGTVTAGNSCPLTDGAAALVLTDADDIQRFAAPPLGYITSYAVAGCQPRRMGLGPVYAMAKLLSQTGLRLSDFDLIELNEAFAAQVIACERAADSTKFAREELGLSSPLGEIPREKVNVHGGAIALGHPVGTTGTRLILTLLRSLRASGGRRGLATLCVGGGQGVAMVLETQRSEN